MRKTIIMVVAVMIVPALLFLAMPSSGQAEVVEIRDVKVSNPASVSFTISWVTEEKVKGNVLYGVSPDGLNKVAYDKRGEDFVGYTHYVEITSLTPGQTYYYKLNHSGYIWPATNPPLNFTTFLEDPLPFEFPHTIFGQVNNSMGKTETGALVYIRIQSGENTSVLLSTYTDNDGYFSYAVGFVYDEEGNQFVPEEGAKLNITINAYPDGKLTDTTKEIGAASPQDLGVFTITLPFFLEDGSVSPTSGDTNTTFTFSITYVAADNVLPDKVWVWIGTDKYEMNAADPSDTTTSDGKVYKYSTKLSAETYAYYFQVKRGSVDVSTKDTGQNAGTLTVTQATINNVPPPSNGGESTPWFWIGAGIVMIVVILLALVAAVRRREKKER